MTTTTTETTSYNVIFKHVLPSERLGTSHSSLISFQNAISPYSPSKQKHYTLVIVTEPLARRILLGIKQRGFGKGMYNSFGGKVEENEQLEECASRELLEETGIYIPANKMATCHVGELYFSFDDSETEMVVHVFRVNITTTSMTNNNEKDNVYVDPSTIRPCDEIIPEWFDDYGDIPLDNMFADDSLWLTRLLQFPPNNNATNIHMEGHFFFEPGGQSVNTIRHYYLSFAATTTKRQNLERQLFHQLHVNRTHNPSIKEFKEAFAFAKTVQKKFQKESLDVILDVAGGHGALAALLLILMPSVMEAVVIDPANVGNNGVQRAWGRFYPTKTLRYRHECLTSGLPLELERLEGLNVLVVACHACQHLSEEVLEMSCRYGASVAVMPCCQRDSSPGCSWKNTTRNLGIPIEKTMDILLAGRVMGWSDASQDNKYDVRIKTIDETITPQNRIITCRRVDGNDDAADAKRKRAHEKLLQAYRKAHETTSQSRSRSQAPRRLDDLCWKSVAVGVAIGVSVSIIVTRRQ